jgi:hypothetical protein
VAEFTADQIMQGIPAAIKAKDFKAVVALLKMLAMVDPYKAELVYESMLAVLGPAGESAAR